MNKKIGIKVKYEGNTFKTENDKLYALMFGTTIFNKSMHWSWVEIDKSSKLGKEVMEFIENET